MVKTEWLKRNRTVLFILIAIFILYIIYNIIMKIHNNTVFKICPTCEENEMLILNSNIVLKNKHEVLNLLANINDYKKQKTSNHVSSIKLNYDDLVKYIPHIISELESNEFRSYLSTQLNVDYLYSLNDKERIFARLYNQKGDYINWHYDDNMTIGKKYTFMMPLYIDDYCNTAYFQYLDKTTGDFKTLDLSVGQFVLYNGSEVYHRVSSQKTNNCNRLVLIMPLYENTKMSIIKKMLYAMKSRLSLF